MNGENQLIYDEIKNNGKSISKIYTQLEGMKTTQILQHKSNVEDIKEIKGNTKKFSSVKTQVHFQWVVLAIIIGWLIKVQVY